MFVPECSSAVFVWWTVYQHIHLRIPGTGSWSAFRSPGLGGGFPWGHPHMNRISAPLEIPVESPSEAGGNDKPFTSFPVMKRRRRKRVFLTRAGVKRLAGSSAWRAWRSRDHRQRPVPRRRMPRGHGDVLVLPHGPDGHSDAGPSGRPHGHLWVGQVGLEVLRPGTEPAGYQPQDRGGVSFTGVSPRSRNRSPVHGS